MNGRFLLRVEDIDTGRSREEYIKAIFSDLEWMGLTWEQPVRRQSEHFDDYKMAIDRLLDMKLLYPCFATRNQILNAISKQNSSVYPLDPDGAPVYPGIFRDLDHSDVDERLRAGEPYAYRINMEAALGYLGPDADCLTIECIDDSGTHFTRKAEPRIWGDAVIMRKDTPTSYHLSVVVDDAIQKITHVTRGRDLEQATDLHRLLQQLLDLPSPIYHHHPLLLDSRGLKLSKSRGSKSLQDLRNDGVTRDQILEMIARR